MGQVLDVVGLGAPKVSKQKEPQKTQVDPNRGAQFAEARKRQTAAARAAGRSSLRIDLAGIEPTQTRSGLTIV